MLDRGRVLVAFPQGAGKTPLTLYVTESLREEFGEDFQVVVICASGLKDQWSQFISQYTGGDLTNEGTKNARWVGGVPSVIVTGTRDRRAKLYRQIEIEHPPYVIIGYEEVVNDYGMVQRLQRDCMIGDEITAIKSPAAARSQALKTLDAPFIFGLTGDPIENGTPIELFSIMEWIDDTVLGRPDLFDKAFVIRHPKQKARVVGYRNLPQLFAKLEPAMVRVSEDDSRLKRYLPKMRRAREHIIPFDPATAKVYSVIAADLVADLEEASRMRRGGFNIHAVYSGTDPEANVMQGRIASKLNCLRMLCDDPDVLYSSGERYLAAGPQPTVWQTVRGQRVRRPKTRPGSAYAAALLEAELLDDLTKTPKLDAVRARIDDLLQQDEVTKVIVFCFYKDVLRGLRRLYGARSVQFDGDMSVARKGDARRAFQHDPAVRLFLSSDAGGYGLDLPQAQYLLNIDLPFSAGKSKQRNTRHRRASSTFDRVFVENFLMRDSIEEFYAVRLGQKQRVASAIIDNIGADRRGRLDIDAQSLRAFLIENTIAA